MHRGQIFTPALLRVGRPPALLPCDRVRVEQALSSAPSLASAAAQLGVGPKALRRFVRLSADLQALLVRRRDEARLPPASGRRPRILLAVDKVRETMAAAPSLIGAARILRVSLWLLRRFAAAHGLRCADGRRRR